MIDKADKLFKNECYNWHNRLLDVTNLTAGSLRANEEDLLIFRKRVKRAINGIDELAKLYAKRYRQNKTPIRFYGMKLLFLYEVIKNSDGKLGYKKWKDCESKDEQGNKIIINYTFNPESRRIIAENNRASVYLKDFFKNLVKKENKDTPFYRAANFFKDFFYFAIKKDTHDFEDFTSIDIDGVFLELTIFLTTLDLNNIRNKNKFQFARFMIGHMKYVEDGFRGGMRRISSSLLFPLYCKPGSKRVKEFVLSDQDGRTNFDKREDAILYSQKLRDKIPQAIDKFAKKIRERNKKIKEFIDEIDECLLVYSNIK